jgi:hypothetical protein
MSRFIAAAVVACAAVVLGQPLMQTPGWASAPAVQLTGTQLAPALLPASAFHSKYRLQELDPLNSGSRLEDGKAKYDLATLSCRALSSAGPLGFGETAMALNFYAMVGGPEEGYAQEVYQFPSTAAAAGFFHERYRSFVRCPVTTEKAGTSAVRSTVRSLTASRVHGLAAFQVEEVTASSGRTGYTNALDVLSGTDVLLVSFWGWPAAPAAPAPQPLVLALAARVHALGG